MFSRSRRHVAASLCILLMFLTGYVKAQDIGSGDDIDLMDIPMISSGPANSNVTYGNDIVLTCTVFSNGEVNITWNTTAAINLPDPNTIYNSTGLYISNITLSNVNTSHNGLYTCIAVNGFGIDTESATLTVSAPLPVVTVAPDNTNILPTMSLSLTCNITSLAPPTVYWNTTAAVNEDQFTVTDLTMDTVTGIYSSVLNIDSVLPEHDGIYTCTAVNIGGMANSTAAVNVQIEAPVVSILIGNVVTTQHNINYNDDLVLLCNAVSHVPITSVIWTQPNGESQTAQLANDTLEHNSTLTISMAKLSDRGRYTCTASNSAGSNSTDIDIGVIVTPPIIEPIPNISITVGYNVTFTCNATGTGLTYQWTFSPQIFNCFPTNSSCIRGLNESVLTILSIPQHFSTNVTCNVTDIDEQWESETAELVVNGLVLIDNGFGGGGDVEITRVENETFSLSCTFQHPTDLLEEVIVDWSNFGIGDLDETTNPSTMTVSYDNGTVFSTLTFNPLERYYDFDLPEALVFIRSFACYGRVGERIEDILGGGVVKINIQFTPFIRKDTQDLPQNPTRINLGDTLEVACYIVGNPIPLIFYEDVTNGNAVILSDLEEISGESPYRINLTEVSRRDYRCVGNNTFGLRFYDFEVIIQDRPQPIDSNTIVITPVSLFSVRVNWAEPFDNLNDITSYVVSYNEILPVNVITNITSVETSTKLENLGIDKNYSLVIIATNAVGTSERSNPVLLSSVTTADASLKNVLIPCILVTMSSIYIQWTYPVLVMNPIEEDRKVDIKHILITLKSSRLGDDMIWQLEPFAESLNITTNLEPDSKYTVEVNIIYNNPSNLEGNPSTIETQTLPADNLPEERPSVNDGSLTGDRPSLEISWMPLTAENGGNFLNEYIVRVTTTQLPQLSRSKRQVPQTTTEDYRVDKDQSNFQLDAKPFTLYTLQVLADLTVNGVSSTVPVTGPRTVESGESAPTAPLNLISSDESFTSITLSWSLPNPPNGVITSYTIYQTGPNRDITVIPLSSTSTTHTITGLVGDTTYSYEVSANTSAGEGDRASVTATTLAGVYPPAVPMIEKGPGRTILVSIPKFSTQYGPLSHYAIIIVTGDTNISSISALHPHTNPRWADLGYYVAAVFDVTDSGRNYTVGNGSTVLYSGTEYFNAPLEENMSYRIIIRVYSGSTSAERMEYRDSPVTIEIEFTPSSALNIAAVVVPILLAVIIMIVVIIIVVVVILYLRREPKHVETFYLDEIKTTVKPLSVDPNSNGTNRSNSANRNAKGGVVVPPMLAIQTSEIYTSIGQPTILLCEVKGTPTPDVLWSKDGHTLQGPEYKIMGDGSLYIVNTKLKDDGEYVVSAYNDGGTVEESMKVLVIVPLCPESDLNHPPQTVSEFIERMALLHSTMDEQLELDYHDIEQEWNITVYNAKLPINHNKNRYVNIIPYDHSRLTLSIQENMSGTDYINASRIDGFNEPDAYIATQGPIPSTFADFWRMLWEYDVPTIVMVTNLKEDDKIKCHQYWPNGQGNYGDIQVSLKEVENIVDYSIRTFQIKKLQGGPTKEIRQFHFQVWPDHGVPQYATALLGFRKRIRKYHVAKKGPMVVHCSAGVGRTGTFICIDSMMKMIEAEGKVDIFNFVRQMRFRRNYMVQTSTQYEFIHEALLETIMCGDTSLPVKSLSAKVVELNQVDPKTGKSGFLSQFQTLQGSCPAIEDFDFSIAQLPDNLNKTRSTKYPPSNENRVVLSTNKYDSDYICATFIDGYRQRQCFITAQGPMKNTAGDFWRMIWEYKTSAIVMLTNLEEYGVEQSVQYWPNENTEEIYGSFVIKKCQEERMLPEYTVRRFNIHHIDNSSDIRTVSHFHYTNWMHDVCPANATSLNDMIGEVLRVQRKSGNNPITVHCSDGLGRTGTFCAAFTVLERVKAEQVVDIFSTVKSLRIQHPGLLETLDQYEFIHKVVLEFLTTFDNYNNFK